MIGAMDVSYRKREPLMRVKTIEIADVAVSSTAVRDSDGGFVWVVTVADRGWQHHTILERRGRCGGVALGDALDVAAQMARGVADRLVISARDGAIAAPARPLPPDSQSGARPKG
jgi:hypothetical protein